MSNGNHEKRISQIEETLVELEDAMTSAQIYIIKLQTDVLRIREERAHTVKTGKGIN